MERTLIMLCVWTLGATLLTLPISRVEAQVDLSAKIAAAKSAADQEASRKRKIWKPRRRCTPTWPSTTACTMGGPA